MGRSDERIIFAIWENGQFPGELKSNIRSDLKIINDFSFLFLFLNLVYVPVECIFSYFSIYQGGLYS